MFPGSQQIWVLCSPRQAPLVALFWGYSHGGAVAQQFAHDRPERVNRLLLACTYACNVATRREQIEAKVAVLLLTIMSTRSLVRLIVRPSASRHGGPVGLDARQAAWLRDLMSVNRSSELRT